MSVFFHFVKMQNPWYRKLFKTKAHLIKTIFTQIIPRLRRLALQSSSDKEADGPSPCKNHQTQGNLMIQGDRSNAPHKHNE